MYKCLNCGNISKFIGYVKESGPAFIYQNPDSKEDISWAYTISGKKWKSKTKVLKCFFCKSTSIIKLSGPK